MQMAQQLLIVAKAGGYDLLSEIPEENFTEVDAQAGPKTFELAKTLDPNNVS